MKRNALFLAAGLALASSLLGANTAIQPVGRPEHVWKNKNNETWTGRHEGVKAQAAKGQARLVFIGDSITHGWDDAGREFWEKDFAQHRPINMGFGGDRTEHVLWRIQDGELDGIQPKVAVVMIGTNNWRTNTPEEIAEGVDAVCRLIHQKSPKTEILLLAIFPRADRDGEPSAKIAPANSLIAQLGQRERVHFLDIGGKFLDADGKLPQSIMPDLLHPNKEGYRIWTDAVAPEIETLMNR